MTQLNAIAAACIPMDRRHALARGQDLPDRTEGAALFADISGFTPLTRTLVQEIGPRQGAEMVLQQLNQVYAALITQVHTFGGSVVGFAGDGLTAWFDAAAGGLPLAAERAATAALAMQTALTSYQTLRTPAGVTIPIGVKIGLAAGPARRLLVGDPATLRIDVLAGATLVDMSLAESLAAAGEIVASPALATFLADSARFAGSLPAGDGRAFSRLAGLNRPAEPAFWPPLPAPLAAAEVRAWLPDTIAAQLSDAQPVIGDLRPVTPLFIRFAGIDYDGDDDAGAQLDAYVRWVQQVVHDFDGTLLQLTMGDKGSSLYAVFGAPTAHDDDPERALRAALVLQAPPEGLAPLAAPQIGLSRGDLWTGIIGAAARHCYGVMGDDVNLSSRLTMRAAPGQTVVSEKMGRYAGFRFEPLGSERYKGFNRPIATFRLLGEALAGAGGFAQALVGREMELAVLAAALAPIFAGQFAGAATILGDAGMGKTRLAHELRLVLSRQPAAAPLTWLAAQTDQVLRQPFNPFAYLLSHAFPYQSPAGETRREQFARQMADLAAGAAAHGPRGAALAAELRRTTSILGTLVGLHWPDSLYEQLDAAGRYENTIIALKTYLQVISLRGPTVLLVEDAHWLDQASRAVLSALTRNMDGFPLALLLTSRHNDDGTAPVYDLAPDIPRSTLTLGTLTPAALDDLAANLLGDAIAPDLSRMLLDKSQANPFFAQQILYYLQEQGGVARLPSAEGGYAWTLTGTAFDLPTSINTILVARLDRLTGQVKGVVQAAAVLGREFEVRLLRQMLQNDVSREVAAAAQAQIWASLTDVRYLFKHTLLQEAAYRMQFQARLRRLHGLAAAAYETLYAEDLAPHYADLAHHYGQAGHEAAERHYAWLAGRQAADLYANEEALRFLNRALALTPPEDVLAQYERLMVRETVYDVLGRREEQGADVAALLELAAATGDPALQAEAALRQAHYAERVSDFAAAAAAAERAVALAEQVGDQRLAANGRRQWADACFRQGNMGPVAALYEQALDLARAAGAPEIEANIRNGLGNAAWLRGDYAAAAPHYEASLARQQQVGDRRGVISCLNNLGVIARRRADPMGARAYFQQALTMARDIGHRLAETTCLSNLGLIADDLGDYGAAETNFWQTLDIAREIGDRQGESRAYNNLGTTAQHQGAYDQARRYYEAALVIARQIGDRRGECIRLVNLALLYGQWRHFAEAVRYGQTALELALESDSQFLLGHSHLALGHALLGTGRLAPATEYYETALAIWTELAQNALVTAARAGLARAMLAAGQTAAALAEVELILDFLASNTLNRDEEFFQIYLTCYQVLAAAADARAAAVLADARRLLQEQAARIPDADMRRAYLERVPIHAEIMAL